MVLTLTPHEKFILSVFLFKNFTTNGATESLKFAQLTGEVIPDLTREFLRDKKTSSFPICPHCHKAFEKPLAPDAQPSETVEIALDSVEFLKTLLNRYQRSAEEAIVLSRIEMQMVADAGSAYQNIKFPERTGKI